MDTHHEEAEWSDDYIGPKTNNHQKPLTLLLRCLHTHAHARVFIYKQNFPAIKPVTTWYLLSSFCKCALWSLALTECNPTCMLNALRENNRPHVTFYHFKTLTIYIDPMLARVGEGHFNRYCDMTNCIPSQIFCDSCSYLLRADKCAEVGMGRVR